MLAVIPARGGSKGLKNKNLAPFAGKPLIIHTISAALRSQAFDRVVVTSDSDEILGVVKAFSSEVTLVKRPSKLASDNSPTINSVLHVLLRLEQDFAYVPSAMCLLQPTSPLRTIEDILKAKNKFMCSDANYLITVTTPWHHPQDCVSMVDGKLSYVMERRSQSSGLRRQDFEQAFFIDGSMYMTNTEYLKAEKAFFELHDCELYEMPSYSGADIDSQFDLTIAEALFNVYINPVTGDK